MKKIWITLGVVGLLASGCGSDGGEKAVKKNAAPKPSSMVQTKEAEPEVADEDREEVTLELAGDDQMKFDKTELRVPAGSKVTLKLTHTGKLPIKAMGHNFVLLKQGVDIAAFGMKAIEAGIDNGHIPEGNDIIAHTDLIGGGESTSITFNAPAKGTYDYICSFPGHYGMMQGKFIVE